MKHFHPAHYSLVLHRAAKAELDLLFEKDEDTASAILAFLQEVKGSQSMLDTFTRNGFVQDHEPRYDVKEWAGERRKRRILWRVRHWSLRGAASRYRIVYAFHPVQFRYYVLAIIEREFDYAADHPVTKRIQSVYDALDIPRY